MHTIPEQVKATVAEKQPEVSLLERKHMAWIRTANTNGIKRVENRYIRKI